MKTMSLLFCRIFSHHPSLRRDAARAFAISSTYGVIVTDAVKIRKVVAQRKHRMIGSSPGMAVLPGGGCRLAALPVLQRREPLGVERIADHVPIEVRSAVGPPDRATFSKRHLGGVHTLPRRL